jgi:hypothetical protein
VLPSEPRTMIACGGVGPWSKTLTMGSMRKSAATETPIRAHQVEFFARAGSANPRPAGESRFPALLSQAGGRTRSLGGSCSENLGLGDLGT